MFGLSSTEITAIIAVAAVVSPVFTSIINNCFHLAEKVMDSKNEKRKRTTDYKRKVIENYLCFAGRLLSNAKINENKQTADYKEAYTLALLYVPTDLRNEMINIDRLLRLNKPEAAAAIEELIPKLEDLLGRL